MADNEMKCNCGNNAKEHLKQVEEESFAMTLLKECSRMARRSFWISIVEGIIILSMIIGGVWFFSTSDIESYALNTHNGGNASIIQNGGEVNNGTN